MAEEEQYKTATVFQPWLQRLRRKLSSRERIFFATAQSFPMYEVFTVQIRSFTVHKRHFTVRIQSFTVRKQHFTVRERSFHRVRPPVYSPLCNSSSKASFHNKIQNDEKKKYCTNTNLKTLFHPLTLSLLTLKLNLSSLNSRHPLCF